MNELTDTKTNFHARKIAAFIFVFLTAASAFAKRAPAPEVPPVITQQKEFQCGYQIGLLTGKAFVRVNLPDGSARKITVYRNWFIPFCERDVQFVLIKKMELLDQNTILITNENEKTFYLDVQKLKVRRGAAPFRFHPSI